MLAAATDKLYEDVLEQVAAGVVTFGVVGTDPVSISLARWFRESAPRCEVTFFGSPEVEWSRWSARPLVDLASARPEVLIVAADDDKEEVIRGALPFLDPVTKILLAGYGHLKFRDPLCHEISDALLVPSIANGYPNTLVHLYECLVNASLLGLEGVVAEFGVFKGGTTMFLASTIARLGETWPVIGFDTFGGFPPRRSALDMYDHPGAEYRGEAEVRNYLSNSLVELVVGDIVETSTRLEKELIVLTFIDTDNYSSARAALDIVADRTVPGGAIVFDHYTGVDRFRYTLGERMAADSLSDDPRYFNLHSTGVFLRQG